MTKKAPLLFFARHGETEWNRQGRIQGWTDTPLNAEGASQAAHMAPRFAEILNELGHDYRLMVSPLLRARATMGYLLRELALPEDAAVIDPQVIELSFGIWEGKTFEELRSSPDFPADPEARFNWRPEGGESYADGLDRIKGWLAGLTGPSVVVSHGAFGRVLIGYLTGLSVAETVAMRIPQGKFCQIDQGQLRWFDGAAKGA